MDLCLRNLGYSGMTVKRVIKDAWEKNSYGSFALTTTK